MRKVARSSWREADLRGRPEKRPISVTSVVEHTRRGLAAARLGEAVLFGASAFFFVLGTAVLEGASFRRDAVLVATLGGVLVAVAWWWEHRPDTRNIARKLDRRLRFQGALLTAFEEEARRAAQNGSAPSVSMGRLVCERVLARLRPREALRALCPSLIPPVAAPFLGAGFLALALEESRPAPPVGADVARLAAGMVATLGDLGAEARNAGERGELSGDTVRDLLRTHHKLRELERDLQRAEELREAKAPHELEALLGEIDAAERELAELARRAASQPELQRRLESARTYLDATRTGLGAGTDLEEPVIPGETGATAGAHGSGARALTGEASEGKMSGSQTEDDPSDPGPAATPPLEPGRESAGVQPTWPAGYDELVRLWIEARQRAMESR